MKSARQMTIVKTSLYAVLLLGLFLSAISTGSSTPVRAQERATDTPIANSLLNPRPTQEPDEERIVGGALADPGEYPWQVEVYAGGLCGGTIIHAQWILTAAHCITEPNGTITPAGSIYVYAGQYDRVYGLWTEKTVSQVIRHPSYNQATYDHDIALLQLTSPLTYGEGSNPPYTRIAGIAPVQATIGSLSGVNAWVTGWGATSSGGNTSNLLLEVQVPVIANSVCNDANHYNGDITNNMLCAGYDAGGKDACQGDSGGPLIVTNPTTGKWNLAGIVSWGSGCAQAYRPGVYTSTLGHK